MKNKKLSSPPPPNKQDSDSDSDEYETEEESDLETNHHRESSEDQDQESDESGSEEKLPSGAGKIRKRRGTLAPGLVFTMNFLRKVAKNFTQEDDTHYKKTLAEYDWSKFTDQEDDLREHLKIVCLAVIRGLTMHQILSIAITDKKYLCLRNRKRGLNAYTLFVKEYAKSVPHMDNLSRFANMNKAYKLLSTVEKQRYEEEAKKINAQPYIENGSSPKVPAKSPAKPTYPSIKTFFETSSKSDSTPKKYPKVEAAPALPSKPKTQKSNSGGANTNQETVGVKLYDYFAEERKQKFGKEKAEVVKKKFAELTVEQKVKFMYKIMESVESKFNKRAVLSKQDQDILNAYEERPANPGTAYTLFVGEQSAKPSLASLPFSERTKKIGSMWKNLDAEEKSLYEKKYAKKKSEYEANYNRFLENLPEFRREQESSGPKGGKRVLKRRASVGEATKEINIADESISNTSRVKSTSTATKRLRSKTIDSSAIAKINKLNIEDEVDATPPSAKRARRANEKSLNGSELKDDSVFVSPTKKAKKAVVDELPSPVVKSPIVKEKTSKTPLAKAKTPVVKDKKKTPAKETPKPPPVTESALNSTTPNGKSKKKNAIEPEREEEIITPSKKAKKKTNVEQLPSPIKKTTSPLKNVKSKSNQPVVLLENLPAPVNDAPDTPTKAKKSKTGEGKKSTEEVEPTSSANVPTEAAKKKGSKKKNKAPIPEPEKPPHSTKAYFKSKYEGDKEKANKVFKKLPQEEKERYHQELQVVNAKYIDDFRRYLESLSKEELAEYVKRNNN